MTLKQLELFLVVAREGTLASAAKSLHMTPGSISVALDSLERELGIQVLARKRAKGATLTAAGHELLQYAQQVVDTAQDLESAAGSIRGELVGDLRISCFNTLSPWLLPPVMEHFTRNHPAVNLLIEEDSSDDIQQKLLRGEINAAFTYRLHVDTDLASTDIAPVRLQLVLSEHHRLANCEEVHFSQLGDEPAIILGVSPAPDLTLALAETAGFRPNVKWRLRNVETIRSLVARGLGYTVTIGRPRGDRTYEGRKLLYKQIADPLPDNAVQLVYQPGALENSKVRELRIFALSALSSITNPMQHSEPTQ